MKILAFISLFIFLTACSSTTNSINENSAEGLFKYAQKLEKSERFEESIARYSEIKSRHPYSKYAVEAELKIAEVYYKRETFIEAEHAFKMFKELHPRHSKSAYVTYRLGMTLYKQLPSTIDRDLSLAKKAILYFDEVIDSYSTSSFVEKAKEQKNKTVKMLAEKELYIANFYFIRKHYDSALKRYEDFLANFSVAEFEKTAAYGAATSAYRKKDFQKAKHYLEYLAKYHKDTSEYKKAKSEMKNGL